MSMHNKTFLVFDVESIGLHGEGFAVAGAVLTKSFGVDVTFVFSCSPDMAYGSDSDREWVRSNVPLLNYNCKNTNEVRNQFWNIWNELKNKHDDLVLAAECTWPVEARFLNQCVDDNKEGRNWEGPYPLYDISSIMFSAGLDPLAEYERVGDENPAHHPLSDVMQSCRLLKMSILKLHSLHCGR